MSKERITVLDFRRKKENGEKITMLTAYDYPMASILDSAGIDAVLVGDSLAMVVLGQEDTLGVGMDEMVHHAKAVSRGVKRSFLIGDMPFMSYQPSDRDAVKNAGRFVQEAGCQAVKLEGGSEVLPRVKAITEAGIPVLGHIGLTPQSVNKIGGYKVQGRFQQEAEKLTEDATLLEKAGCFALILECVPEKLAGEITSKLKIPTIGIGAGKLCDGQVLVTYDMVGYFDKFVPKFVRRYAEISKTIKKAVLSFKKQTEEGSFPSQEESF
ncbi:MAG: 3-methyl-2-oxobutanoate hydroxymethyltransferase [Candidatus Omnitrophica bacterium]|nr:3-methyl-2-oxobutanoate hydroxymethyltransferase [Candidatus Omnitrophota bacterium]